VALYANTTGSNSIAIGEQALYSNTTATSNTAVGYQAGYTGTTGNSNTFVGQQAGYTTNGSQNVMVGLQTGNSATTSYMTALGYQAGYNCTDNAVGSTFVGWQAGKAVTSGTGNCFVGQAGSGNQITTGSKNSIFGAYNGNQGGLDIRTSNNYVVLSDGDGNIKLTCDNNNNVLIGATSITGFNSPCLIKSTNSQDTLNLYRTTSNTPYGTLVVSSDVYATAGITCRINANGNLQNYNNSYGAISDVSLKENIVDATPKLADLAKVQIRNFNFKADQTKTKQIGVVAQELETVFPSMVEECEDGTKSVKYSIFVPMLIKAIQELNTLVTTQAAEIAALKAKVGA
jgi:hypothetical protein